MKDRITSLVFFLVVTTFHHHSALGDSTTIRTDFPTKSSIDECVECIERARISYSKTVTDPKQFCIDNELCPKSPAPSSQPTENPSESPSTSPSKFHSDVPSLFPSTVPTSGQSAVPSDGPSLLPSEVPSGIPSVAPSEKPTTIPSNLPSLSSAPTVEESNHPTSSVFPSGEPTGIPSSYPSDGISEIPSDGPSIIDILTSSRVDDTQLDKVSVSTNESILSSSVSHSISSTKTPSISPTKKPSATLFNLLPGIFQSTPSNSIQRVIPSGTPSSQPSYYESLPTNPMDLDPTSTNEDSWWRTTVSSLFLKNLASPMDPEVTEIFSSTALQFLRDYSSSVAVARGVEFIYVKVVGQGPELGNSTEFHAHIDGMHIYFETIADIEDNVEIDLPWLIENIFKINKNEFFARLAESSEFFLPVGIESRSTGGNLGGMESGVASTSDFMNSWVISSLAVVVFSVFLTTLLMTRMVKRIRPRRFQEDSAKRDFYPLNTLVESFSDHSTETINMGNKKGKSNTAIDKYDMESFDSAVSKYEKQGGMLSICIKCVTLTQSSHWIPTYAHAYKIIG